MITIDGANTNLRIENFANLEEILATVMQDEKMDDRVVTDVFVNNEIFSEIYPHQAEDMSCDAISSVEVRSVPAAELAVDMSAEMGIAPYDSAAFIITKYAGERVSFRTARIATDVTVVLVGIVFSIAGGNSVWQAAGLGTVICSLCNGPLIQYFRSILQIRA